MSRTSAPFLVKRLAPRMGRPNSPRRVTIAHQCYSLATALEKARFGVEHRRFLEAARAREGDPHGWITNTIAVLERTAIWIERRGFPAAIPAGAGAR